MDFAQDIKSIVEVLQAGGPYAVAVIMGIWGWKKDQAKEKQSEQYLNRLIELHVKHAEAIMKMEGTISSLKELIQALSSHKR